MRLMRNLMLLFGLSLIGGCVQSDPCGWASPIRQGRDDVLTIETARQILNHNETGAVNCGWKP